MPDEEDDERTVYTLPAVRVSWHDAAEYANWLTRTTNASTGQARQLCYVCEHVLNRNDPFGMPDPVCEPVTDVYACDGYRLPTEAEWEYAARGGESYPFAGGPDVNEVAWWQGNSGWCCDGLNPLTRAVGTRAPNGYGLYDMSGNASEWVNDWVDRGSYPSTPQIDPLGLVSGEERGPRGGNGMTSSYEVRVAHRASFFPEWKSGEWGFRLCRSEP